MGVYLCFGMMHSSCLPRTIDISVPPAKNIEARSHRGMNKCAVQSLFIRWMGRLSCFIGIPQYRARGERDSRNCFRVCRFIRMLCAHISCRSGAVLAAYYIGRAQPYQDQLRAKQVLNELLNGILKNNGACSIEIFPPKAKMPESYRFRHFLWGGRGPHRTLILFASP